MKRTTSKCQPKEELQICPKHKTWLGKKNTKKTKFYKKTCVHRTKFWHGFLDSLHTNI